MATTSSLPVADKASAGQGGNGSDKHGGRFGLKAKLAAGVAILGCAAALTFGGLRGEGATRAQPQAPAQTAHRPAGTDDLATNGCVGAVGPFACQAGQSLAGTDDFATTGCIGTAGVFACAAGSHAPTMWDYREDRRAETRDRFIADQFTYREDRRVDGGPALTPPGPANVQGADH